MDTVKINVSGVKYKISKRTLNKFPQTKLGRMKETWKEYDKQHKEFFFDRNPQVMLSIFDLYRTGELHLPDNVCSFTVKNELKFWQIDEVMISECCWKKYRAITRNTTVIDLIDSSLTLHPDITMPTTDTLQDRMWIAMEYPYNSISSRIWYTVYMLFVLTTVFINCLSTFPQLRISVSKSEPHQLAKSLLDMLLLSDIRSEIYWLDILCLAFFTSEQVVKLAVCPERQRFFKEFLNLMDLALNIIMWTALILDKASSARNVKIAHVFLRSAFCLNVMRIFHLGKFSRTMKMLIFTLKASRAALLMLLASVIMTTLLYATCAYYAEIMTKEDAFPNIPMAIWWTVITMTTVGYGDYHPKSWPGYMVGMVCSFTGIVLIALPIVIIAANFDKYHRNIPAFEQRVRYRKVIAIDNFAFRSGQTDTLQVNDPQYAERYVDVDMDMDGEKFG